MGQGWTVHRNSTQKVIGALENEAQHEQKFVLSRASRKYLTFPIICKVNDPVSRPLAIGYSSLPCFVTNMDKECWADRDKAWHLCFGEKFNMDGGAWPFLQSVIMAWRKTSYLSSKKYDLFIIHWIVWLFGFVEMLNELVMKNKWKNIWQGAERLLISAASGVHFHKKAYLKYAEYSGWYS